MKSTPNNSFATTACLLLSLFLILTHSFFFFNQKMGYYIDETLSFRLANDTLTDFTTVKDAVLNRNSDELTKDLKELNMDVWYSRDEVLSRYTVLDNEKFHYLNTYLQQAFDVHPPLYYAVIKTLCSIFPKTNLMLIGYIINICFLIITCFLVYKIGVWVFNDSFLSITAMLFYGFSLDFINNSTYYRMYAMLTFWMVLSIFLNVKWFKNKYVNDHKTILVLCLIEYLAMMTQYFALFFCIPIFVINIAFALHQKKSVSRYLVYNVVTGIIYLITWPFSIMHILFSNRGDDVTHNLSHLHFLQNIISYKDSLANSIFAAKSKLLIIVFLIVFIVILAKIIQNICKGSFHSWIDTEHFGVMIYLYFTSLIYFVIAANAVPWHVDRYIMPIIPLFCIIIIYSLANMASFVIKKNFISIAFAMAFCIFISCLWHITTSPSYLYNDNKRTELAKICPEHEAIIIDKEGVICNCEIELNFNHPRYFETDDSRLDSISSYIDQDSTYIAYVAWSVDTEAVDNAFATIGLQMHKADVNTDFYNIYYVKSGDMK
ncbi:hypothetical protein [Butyrivibrio sp. AD3002]|uniref:hypothetical protein n=1 Tax=Butyrivibrio sp. AD3002 TaxID=1280670 RepID=UPI0003B5CDBD|nr:hypothetical protein [Butyrivibrio sp. AD3002]